MHLSICRLTYGISLSIKVSSNPGKQLPRWRLPAGRAAGGRECLFRLGCILDEDPAMQPVVPRLSHDRQSDLASIQLKQGGAPAAQAASSKGCDAYSRCSSCRLRRSESVGGALPTFRCGHAR